VTTFDPSELHAVTRGRSATALRPPADRPARQAHSTTDDDAATRLFAEQRDYLVGVAYRILGRVADAEDVVQEAWLRWTRRDPGEVQDARAFLTRVTTRLALDRLRRIKARREEYAGPWLPEPLLADATSPDPSEQVELAESISLAMMVVLETLSPLERAVFVLREVFGLSHAEVGEAVGRSEAAVRQLDARARKHVHERRPRFQSDPATRRQVTERFLAACTTGDVNTLMAILAPDVTLVADGGGKARAPRVPLHGVPAVMRFLAAILQPRGTAKFLESIGVRDPGATEDAPDPRDTFDIGMENVNGGPAIVATLGGRVVTVAALDVVDGRVQTIHLIANPEKLAAMSRRAGGAAS
jgi:RNA polymerase sigma-70 factor (ECF subfamily)